MRGSDYDVVAYDGRVYCVGCLPEWIDRESDEVAPILSIEVWDRRPVCDACGYEHHCVGLTKEGQAYYRERQTKRYHERV
jgi:hypothetical protein